MRTIEKPGPLPELMTTPEAAEYLRLTPEQLRQLRHRNVAPPAVRVGKGLRWRRSDIERWLDNGGSKAAS